MTEQEIFINKFTDWVSINDDILGVALVGSYVRGKAKIDSDIDLVIIAKDRKKFLDNNEWAGNFGIVTNVEHENFGLVQSVRVFYKNGLEVEFGITTSEWLDVNSIDDGTKKVMDDGYKILNDKAGLFSEFISKL